MLGNNVNCLNIDNKTRKAQGIILDTLDSARKEGSREVDFRFLKENTKEELLYLVDAITILQEESLIYSPSYGVFGITTAGIDEYNLRKSTGSLS